MMRTPLAVAAFCCLAPLLSAQPEVLKFRPFDPAAFAQHMQSAMDLSKEDVAAFHQQVKDETAKHAVDNFLRRSFKDYAVAVELADQQSPKAALALAKVLVDARDPYLLAYTQYQMARVFLDADDPEEAATILSEFVHSSLNLTPLDSEVIYFFGHSLAQIPERERAVEFFQAFLHEFPEAPERLRASATQILAELRQQEGFLHPLADDMKWVERRIRKTRTGEETQAKQQMVIEELQKIIEQLEQMENQAGGAPGGAGGSPANRSALPGGEHKMGPQNKRVPRVVEQWGKIKDAERREIEVEQVGKLPPAYRKMLEEYYKKLGKTAQ